MRVVRIIPDLAAEDVDEAYEEAVRRFFVRTPDGHVLNIVRHRE